MKIVIGGAGAVGTHLAKLLSRESHDITIIDQDALKLRSLENSYDLSTVIGSVTSIQTLKMSGVEKADLFVGVTPYESENICSCIYANKFGASKTIARIDNEDYLTPENIKMFRDLGVAELVYPELLAANEVITNVERNWVREWIEFHDGALILIGIKVRKGAPIEGLELMKLKNSHHYRLVAIKRDEDTIIPGGHTQVLAGDIVYFITTNDFIDNVREDAGKVSIEVQDMMIMGASKITLKTVETLSDKGVRIKIFDKDEAKIRRVVDSVADAMLLRGDATDMDLLREECISDVDAFAAFTDSSEANVMACLAARRMGVRKIIAQIENSEYVPLAEKLDIGNIVNKLEITAAYIYKYTLGHNVSKLKRLTYAEAEIVELTVAPNSLITKALVKDLKLPQNMFIGGLIRGNIGQIVGGMTKIEPGDKVIVFCLKSSIQNLAKLCE